MNDIQFIPGAIDAGDCVTNAWEMLKKNYGMYLGISVVTMLLVSCIPCLNIFIVGPVMGGFFYVASRDMRGEPADFGMMFKGFEKFVPLMVIGLIQSIPGVIAQVLRLTINLGQLGLGGKDGNYQFFQASSDKDILAGGLAVIGVVVGLVFAVIAIVWWMIMFFAIPLAMENEIGPIDAIKLSARAAMSNIGGLIVLIIFEILVMLVGILLICVGAFLISFPVILLANVFAFRQVFPWAGQQFNMAPPPPNAYGSNFGSGM